MTITSCLLLLLAPLAWIATPAAQNTTCDSSQFNALTNVWKPQPDQNTGQVTAVELATERKIMVRVLEMFKSAFVPIGAIGLYSANYDILSQVANKSRYGNTYSFVLSHHKIECVNGKPAVFRTRDGGESWQRLDRGLPSRAWHTVLRQSMAHNGGTPLKLAFGTTSGEIWGSSDEGDSWKSLATGLPKIMSVTAARME